MEIPFVKAEGAGNDFLITLDAEAPATDRPAVARRICHRHLGIGADGWYLVKLSPNPGSTGDDADSAVDAEIHLYNSDGSEAELSGNGTRCTAAWLATRFPHKTSFTLRTGAGLRRLHVIKAAGTRFRIGMQMGRPQVFAPETIELSATPSQSVTGNRVDPGNPQFAVEVETLDFPWQDLGRNLEGHPVFPNRSNVSFYRAIGQHEIEARFYERGAGATLSSGTGSTGALAAAVARGRVRLPAVVQTQAGPLNFYEDADGWMLDGNATILAEGTFYLPDDGPRATEGT